MAETHNPPAKHGKHGKAHRDDARGGQNRGLVQRVADGAVANPLAMVAGGLAVGAVVGALLPRSERERQLLAPVGARLGSSVTAAVEAARDAGKAELEGAGISRENAREQARNIVEALVRAASTAGSAAVEAAGSARR